MSALRRVRSCWKARASRWKAKPSISTATRWSPKGEVEFPGAESKSGNPTGKVGLTKDPRDDPLGLRSRTLPQQLQPGTDSPGAVAFGVSRMRPQQLVNGGESPQQDRVECRKPDLLRCVESGQRSRRHAQAALDLDVFRAEPAVPHDRGRGPPSVITNGRREDDVSARLVGDETEPPGCCCTTQNGVAPHGADRQPCLRPRRAVVTGDEVDARGHPSPMTGGYAAGNGRTAHAQGERLLAADDTVVADDELIEVHAP